MITFISDDMVFPPKEEANLPVTMGLPMWPRGTSRAKVLFGSAFKRREYIVRVDYITHVPCLEKYCLVPSYFVSDLASIPKVIPLCSHDGLLYPGSIPHDFGYRFKGLLLSEGPGNDFYFTALTQECCDRVFTSLNDKANNLPKFNKAVERLLNVFGDSSYGQRDIAEVDWTIPVY